MKAAKIKYIEARTVGEATAALAEYSEDAKVLAGGQSLVPMLNMRLARPEVLVDISGIDALRQVSPDASGCAYGAMVVHSMIEDGFAPDPTGGLLRQVASGIGYRAVRNRGTLGGSLSHADASAEWPLVMAALDAEFDCVAEDGRRTVRAREFVRGFMTNSLADHELLASVRVAAPHPEAAWGFAKTARKPGEFAESLAVVVVERADGVISGIEAWLGGAGDTPRRIGGLDTVVLGREPERVGKGEFVDAVISTLAESGYNSEYYRHLHGITMWRAWERLGRSA